MVMGVVMGAVVLKVIAMVLNGSPNGAVSGEKEGVRVFLGVISSASAPVSGPGSRPVRGGGSGMVMRGVVRVLVMKVSEWKWRLNVTEVVMRALLSENESGVAMGVALCAAVVSMVTVGPPRSGREWRWVVTEVDRASAVLGSVVLWALALEHPDRTTK